MSKQKQVVHLRVYKSNGINNQISYDSNGKTQNENQIVKLTHDTLSWSNFLKNIRVLGFIKVDVEKVLQPTEQGYEEVKDFVSISKEVEDAFNPKPKAELSPDQKRIAELEAKLEAFMSGKRPVKDIDVDDAEIVDELSIARQEYQEHFSKKGHHTWSVEQIREKIAEDKQKA